MNRCKYCNKEFTSKNALSNHEFRCPSNLNRDISKISRKGIKGTPHTQTTKNKLSDIAKQRQLGGYQTNAGRSKKFKVIDSFGNSVTLQSTYEFKCFQVLTEMNIRWIRPKALKYSGRNYFADFYLVDYDIYLDPKNNYKAKIDQEKISQVIKENQVKIFVLLQNEINNQYLGSILDMQTADNR